MRRTAILILFVLLALLTAHAQYTFTSLDYPGADLTRTVGINNRGDIVGTYRVMPPRQALLIRHGQFIPLAPNTILGTTSSDASKINDYGDVVGTFGGDDGFDHGFLLRKGVVTTIDFPGAAQTIAQGINNSGVVVGEWDILDANGNLLAYHGFVWKDGAFSEVNFPGSADTSILGVNARGDYVGVWDSEIYTVSGMAHGFIYSKGKFTSFDFPDAPITQAADINADGLIAGVYIDTNGTRHGFLKRGDTYTTLDFPGAPYTAAWGINARGQIVGIHRDEVDGLPRGFIAQPVN